jgi:hypothetical protein
MEQTRLPLGKLNTDDSAEVIDPNDWLNAVNFISGRSVYGRNGGKENVRGTNLVENIRVTQTVEDRIELTNFSITGEGNDWTITDTPLVDLSTDKASVELKIDESSKVLSYTFPTSISPVTLSFKSKFNKNVRLEWVCKFYNEDILLSSQNLTVDEVEQVITFKYEGAEEINRLTLQVVNHNVAVEGINYNIAGNKGAFETDHTTWGFYFVPYGDFSRSSTYKYQGTYSCKYKYLSGLAKTGFVCDSSVGSNANNTGMRLRIAAMVYVPSSNPIANTDAVIKFETFNIAEAPSTKLSEVTRTVAESTNNWQRIEAVYEIGNNPWGLGFRVKVQVGGTWIANGEIYIDQMTITEDTELGVEVELRSPSILREEKVEDIIDEYSQLIGVLKAGSTDDNYLFFYNVNPQKHCILEFNNGITNLVLRWSGLNFSNQKRYRINGGGVTHNSVYFTDDLNQPRTVHKTRYAGGATPSSEEEILLIKRGPQSSPSNSSILMNLGGTWQMVYIWNPNTMTYDSKIEFVSFDDAKGSKLQGSYQFATQYVYKDGQVSVISPWTNPYKSPNGYRSIYVKHTETNVPALVDKVRFIVRTSEANAPFVFSEKKFPFRNPDGTTDDADSVIYFGQTFGELVEPVHLKPYEPVPLRAKAMCIAKSRLWLANYVEGYDSVDTVDITIESDTDDVAGRTFPANSKYRVGIVLFDGEGRSCGVIDKGWLFVTDQDVVCEKTGITKMRYKVKGRVPSWAKSWGIVMSKDLVKSYFVEGISYADHSTQPPYVQVDEEGVETYSATYNADLTKYIRLEMKHINDKGFFYSSTGGGDYCMLSYLRNDLTAKTFGPLKVVKNSGDWVYIEPVNLEIPSPATTDVLLGYQLYNPAVDVSGLYFEVGETRYPIANGIIDTTGLINPLTIEGDSVRVSLGVKTSYVLNGLFEIWTTQVNSFADKFWVQNVGKPHLQIEVGQQHKYNFIKHSSTFIANSNANGLSEFNLGDEGSTSFDSGPIQKLQSTTKPATEGDVILAICSRDTYSIYAGETRVATGAKDGIMAATTKVIGDIRKLKAGCGTLHPESVFDFEGQVFWYDYLAKAFIRYATNGLANITEEVKVISYFDEQSRLNGPDDLVISGFDPFYKFLLLTFAKAKTVERKTIAFSVMEGVFKTFMNFAPAGYFSGSHVMYSCYQGAIYSHDNELEFNKFYGITYDTVWDISFNDEYKAPKDWKALQVQTSPNFFKFEGGNQIIKSTFLPAIPPQPPAELLNQSRYDHSGFVNEGAGLSWLVGPAIFYGNTLNAELPFPGILSGQLTSVEFDAEGSFESIVVRFYNSGNSDQQLVEFLNPAQGRNSKTFTTANVFDRIEVAAGLNGGSAHNTISNIKVTGVPVNVQILNSDFSTSGYWTNLGGTGGVEWQIAGGKATSGHLMAGNSTEYFRCNDFTGIPLGSNIELKFSYSRLQQVWGYLHFYLVDSGGTRLEIGKQRITSLDRNTSDIRILRDNLWGNYVALEFRFISDATWQSPLYGFLSIDNISLTYSHLYDVPLWNQWNQVGEDYPWQIVAPELIDLEFPGLQLGVDFTTAASSKVLRRAFITQAANTNVFLSAGRIGEGVVTLTLTYRYAGGEVASRQFVIDSPNLEFSEEIILPSGVTDLDLQASSTGVCLFYINTLRVNKLFTESRPEGYVGCLKLDVYNQRGQESDMLYNEMEVDEDMIYAEIRGDKNSPGGVVNGDPIYSNTLQCRITFSGGEYKQILLLQAGYELSKGHIL